MEGAQGNHCDSRDRNVPRKAETKSELRDVQLDKPIPLEKKRWRHAGDNDEKTVPDDPGGAAVKTRCCKKNAG